MMKQEEAAKIGERIKELRTKNNVSQRELSSVIGCSQTAIGYWERGKVVAKSEMLIKIAKELGVTYEYLIGIEKEPSLKNGLNSENCTAEEFGKMLDKERSKSKVPDTVQILKSEYEEYLWMKKGRQNDKLLGWKVIAHDQVIDSLMSKHSIRCVDLEGITCIDVSTRTISSLRDYYLPNNKYLFFVKDEEDNK